ncbi:MAG: phospho-N-acetylmuramoyl-pentapeptide-transferase [Deltaproteobacteria bacterium]|jgi:phospho-N-acetylmuramoyl-pentapeptide-transferase|nr:phospho-N-acetylmuramoyl-pentapeptide-transferase [Deltaproteobacteria bacterium]
MLYKLFLLLADEVSAFNVFRYITFRIILASLTPMAVWLFLGPAFIRKIKAYRVSQYIRAEGPESHQAKAGTPTMGGLLLLGASLLSSLMWADPLSPVVITMWLVIVTFAAVGFRDDYLKIRRRGNAGLRPKYKFAWQCVLGLGAGLVLYHTPGFSPVLAFPVFKNLMVDLGPFYVFFAALVLVASSNSVNLTDGLDGLAAGPFIMAGATYMVFAYCAGNAVIANHLQIARAPGAAELAVVLASLIGSGLGFLWYNTYPSQIFMGDVGSLSLGAALGYAALVVKQEILLVLVGGIFVMEALSVICQVSFFKATKGRRLFRMSPIHHHFELKGWPEPKVIVRFWIIAIVLGLAGLSTLKLR